MPEEQKVETPAQETPPEKTPEEQIKELNSQIEQIRKEAEEAKKGLSTAHQTLTRKDQELKKQSDIHSRINNLEDTIKVLASVISETQAADVDNPNLKKERVDHYQKLVEDMDKKRQFADQQSKQREYSERADAVWARATALGLTEEDDDYWAIRDSLTSGNIDRATAKVGKLEKTKTPAAPPKKEEKKEPEETEEAKVERKARELLEKKGLFKSDTAIPSGRGKNHEDEVNKLATGPLNMKRLRELYGS
jgi:hypothetical protein